MLAANTTAARTSAFYQLYSAKNKTNILLDGLAIPGPPFRGSHCGCLLWIPLAQIATLVKALQTISLYIDLYNNKIK